MAMLAKEFKKEKTDGSELIGWIQSEKFDGYRALFFYDKDNNPQFISRTGKKFNAPEHFLNSMPSHKCLKGRILDGELWAGRENFQLMGTVRKKIPIPEEWFEIKFMTYDITNLDKTFTERLVELKKIVKITKEKWDVILKKKMDYPFNNLDCPIEFTEQIKIKSIKMMDEYYQKILKSGGEGIMIKNPDSKYKIGRASDMLKYKPSFDREGIIIGYSPGNGKYEGLLGAFICKPLINHDTYMSIDENEEHIFTISGMDDKVRKSYKKTHPINTIISFECSGYTDKGVPRFARYIRSRDDIIIQQHKKINSNEKLNRIIHIFSEIEKKHKINKDYFRAKSYTKSLIGLKKFKSDEDLTDKNILSIDGLGKSLHEKVKCIIETNTCEDFKIVQQNKEEIELHEEFQKIHGVGPNCAKKLIDLGYKSVQEIMNDPKHSDHLNDVQLKGLLYFHHINQRIPYNEIKLHEKYVKKILKEIDPNASLTISGSFRRKQKDSGDIDILLKSDDRITYENFIIKLKGNGYIRDTLAHGSKKFMGISNIEIDEYSSKNRRIDIMYTTPQEYPFAILYFTGSKEFNVKMRNELLEKGFTLNEYGVNYTDENKKLNKIFLTEKSIFKYFDYEYVKPENR
jgi:DNA polymerase/3'-5' exonuclease PolX